MGYTSKLLAREAELGRPVRVGLVGAGQMGSGFVAQIARQKGVDISVVADIATERATAAFENAGITDAVVSDVAAETARLVEAGGHVAVADAFCLPELPVDLVLECSGVPEVATRIALACLLAGKNVALMTVEADVTVGLVLAKIAQQTGAIYSVCRGDEPVECLKLIEYAEDIGLEVTMAGKGKNNPLDHDATPDTLAEEASSKHMNPKMLCSFVDGTKTMIEMTALANAADLELTQRSMLGPAATVPTLAEIFRPESEGGILDRHGVVDYATGPVAPGVFVIVQTPNQVVAEELKYLKLGPGPYFALYRPYHLASIEACLTIGEIVIDGQPSLAPVAWNADVVATAKKDLAPGDVIDGIGGYTIYADATPAAEARANNELPIGLAAGATVVRPVAKGAALTYDDVELDDKQVIVALRKIQDSLDPGADVDLSTLPTL